MDDKEMDIVKNIKRKIDTHRIVLIEFETNKEKIFEVEKLFFETEKLFLCIENANEVYFKKRELLLRKLKNIKGLLSDETFKKLYGDSTILYDNKMENKDLEILIKAKDILIHDRDGGEACDALYSFIIYKTEDYLQ